MRRPKRSTLLLGLLLLVLATVPVLIPLLVTRPDAAPVDTRAVPVAGATEPAAAAGAGSPAASPTRAGTPAGSPTPPGPTPTTTTTGAPGTAPGRSAAPAGPAPAPRPGPATRPAPTRVPTSASSKPPRPPVPDDPPPVAPFGPDLVVVSVGWLPDAPAAGGQVTFTAVVRNAGDDPTPERTHGIAFSVDGTPVAWSAGSTTPLAAGEERVYTADGGPTGPAWTAEPGDHVVEAWADDQNHIPEPNESDNKAQATLTIATP